MRCYKYALHRGFSCLATVRSAFTFDPLHLSTNQPGITHALSERAPKTRLHNGNVAWGLQLCTHGGCHQNLNVKFCEAPTHNKTSTDVDTAKHRITMFTNFSAQLSLLNKRPVQQSTLTDPQTPSISGPSIYSPPSGWHAQNFSRVSPSPPFLTTQWS